MPPRIMGILNLTPDSFSDGGKYTQPELAIQYAQSMVEQGADMIDIGGESSRPGAKQVPPEIQIQRTRDIIYECHKVLPQEIVISIDTRSAKVAEAAIDAGATMINDISAGTEDPDMLELVAERKVSICLMHMQGKPENMQDAPSYQDVVAEVNNYLLQQANTAIRTGIAETKIMLDPGIGFGKTEDHNLRLLNQLHVFVANGFTTVLGTSKKRFMTSHTPCVSTVATTTMGVMAGINIFRVHEVKENRIAADLAHRVTRQGGFR